jgi:hypothetical protein
MEAWMDLPAAKRQGQALTRFCNSGGTSLRADLGHGSQLHARLYLFMAPIIESQLFGWLVADGWCWFVLR